MNPSLAYVSASVEETILLRQLEMALPRIVQQHEEFWNAKILENLSLMEQAEEIPESSQRPKRDTGYPAMMMKKTKKVRTCQNMSGVLGGANAFNFLSFVAGVITLIVNVNNNVNNNNNNLNGISANANNNQNNNANVNNNAANIIIAMPGRKRRKRSDPWDKDIGQTKCDGTLELPNEATSLPIVLMRLMQEFYDYNQNNPDCKEKFCGPTNILRDFLRSWQDSYNLKNDVHSV